LLERIEALQGGTASPSGKPVDAAKPGVSEVARRVQANAEFMQEMLSVVTLHPPVDATRFGGMVDTLNQGASLEGIYNGLVHSANYRSREEGHYGSSSEALEFFAGELAQLETGFPKPREFDGSAARPLAMIDPLDVSPGKTVKPVMNLEGVRDPKELALAYRKHFAGASVFVLKRVLGDEALRLMALKQAQGPKALAEWYADHAARTAELKIDFGLRLRNRADRAWHLKWAETAEVDRLEWEVLNRLHRIVNAGEAKR